MVIRRTEQIATDVRVPGEAVALFLVASQPQIWVALSRRVYNMNQINNISIKWRDNTRWERLKLFPL